MTAPTLDPESPRETAEAAAFAAVCSLEEASAEYARGSRSSGIGPIRTLASYRRSAHSDLVNEGSNALDQYSSPLGRLGAARPPAPPGARPVGFQGLRNFFDLTGSDGEPPAKVHVRGPLSLPPVDAPALSARLPTELTSGTQRKCVLCGTTKTSQWRRGPHGGNTLCNPCGLHWARACQVKIGKPKGGVHSKAPSPRPGSASADRKGPSPPRILEPLAPPRVPSPPTPHGLSNSEAARWAVKLPPLQLRPGGAQDPLPDRPEPAECPVAPAPPAAPAGGWGPPPGSALERFSALLFAAMAARKWAPPGPDPAVPEIYSEL
eukprot:tig00021127_g18863.t1